MPEAAVHKNYCPVFWQHDIRFSREVFTMQAETESASMQHRANLFFRRCIGAPNSGHHPTSSRTVYNIGHSAAAR